MGRWQSRDEQRGAEAARGRAERRGYSGGFEEADLLGCGCAGQMERRGDGGFEAEDPQGLAAWDQQIKRGWARARGRAEQREWNRASVPKFGTWDTDNVGYTVYFEKVRENKGATAPPLQRPFNPNDPEEDAPRG
ncbi:hypothetical protein ACQ4PT_008101 [Festuca glaucescens]